MVDMLKHFAFLFSVVSLLLSVSGCVTVQEVAPRADAVKIKPQEYELGRKLVTAFVKNDGKTFVSLLPEETRTKFTVESFEKSRKSIVESVGEPVSFTYLVALELPALTPQIWKIRFRRVNPKNNEEFYSELLFRAVTGMLDKKQAVVTGFQFI